MVGRQVGRELGVTLGLPRTYMDQGLVGIVEVDEEEEIAHHNLLLETAKIKSIEFHSFFVRPVRIDLLWWLLI